MEPEIWDEVHAEAVRVGLPLDDILAGFDLKPHQVSNRLGLRIMRLGEWIDQGLDTAFPAIPPEVLTNYVEDEKRFWEDGIDGLTGLLRKDRFMPKYAQIVLNYAKPRGGRGIDTSAKPGYESRFDNRAFAVVMGDHDEFKLLNSKLGHFGADGVLEISGGIFREDLNITDITGRYGGDEYAAVIKGPITRAVQQGHIMITRYAEATEHIELVVDGTPTRPGLTLGIAYSTDFTTDELVAEPHILLRAADEALLAGKEELNQKGTIHLYSTMVKNGHMEPLIPV